MYLLLFVGLFVGSQAIRHSARLVLDFRATGQTGSPSDHVVLGNFSQMGLCYQLQADVVQVHPFRACQLKNKGLDRTLLGNVAVIFMDELEPFIAGCVSLDNQASFARESGASAVIIGPVTKELNEAPSLVDIPVITLSTLQSIQLKHLLSEASDAGYIVNMKLSPNRPEYFDDLANSSGFRPTVFDFGIFLALIILLLFASIVIFIKVKWRPRTHREITLRTLAKSALNSMEVRKYKKNSRTNKSFYHFRTAKDCTKSPFLDSHLCASKVSVISSHEMCAICIEDYRDGQDLRVLFCGHEFHQKCVDPWLLTQRTCPLCQFDVVYQQYPGCADSKPNNIVDCTIETDPVALPLLPEHQQVPDETVRTFLEQFISASPSATSPDLIPSNIQTCTLQPNLASKSATTKRRRSRSRKSSRPHLPRYKDQSNSPVAVIPKLILQQEPLTDGGYLSDISSLDTNRDERGRCQNQNQQQRAVVACCVQNDDRVRYSFPARMPDSVGRCKEFRVLIQDNDWQNNTDAANIEESGCCEEEQLTDTAQVHNTSCRAKPITVQSGDRGSMTVTVPLRKKPNTSE